MPLSQSATLHQNARRSRQDALQAIFSTQVRGMRHPRCIDALNRVATAQYAVDPIAKAGSVPVGRCSGPEVERAEESRHAFE